MEGGTLADLRSDAGGDRAAVDGASIRVPGLGPSSPGGGKGGTFSGRGDQQDEGEISSVSAGSGKTGPVMPSADHSGHDYRNEGMDLLVGAGWEEEDYSKGED